MRLSQKADSPYKFLPLLGSVSIYNVYSHPYVGEFYERTSASLRLCLLMQEYVFLSPHATWLSVKGSFYLVMTGPCMLRELPDQKFSSFDEKNFWSESTYFIKVLYVMKNIWKSNPFARENIDIIIFLCVYFLCVSPVIAKEWNDYGNYD